jgi:hypothetical protein
MVVFENMRIRNEDMGHPLSSMVLSRYRYLSAVFVFLRTISRGRGNFFEPECGFVRQTSFTGVNFEET